MDRFLATHVFAFALGDRKLAEIRIFVGSIGLLRSLCLAQPRVAAMQWRRQRPPAAGNGLEFNVPGLAHEHHAEGVACQRNGDRVPQAVGHVAVLQSCCAWASAELAATVSAGPNSGR